MPRHQKYRHLIRSLLLAALSIGLFMIGVLVLWVSSWRLPDITSFRDIKITESTKIYDRTGEILLFDLNGGAKRTIVPYGEISRNVKNATVAIEDDTFWQHHGVRPESFLRALFINLGSGSFSQGGSTITQQVVKNSLLTSEKKISRKIKEWVLAWKLENVLSKEEILGLYLNQVPYGGTVYGIEEASETFLGKKAGELSIAEAAYMAALPNAPTYYSPYGNHKDKLEERKNFVLRRMKEIGFITEEEYEKAKEEKVIFRPPAQGGILAPHFVFFIRQYLEDKYGPDAVKEGGLKIITTLDYNLQKIAEDIVKKYALENKQKFDAENAALTAVDPQTGQILVMVGSRDYFDKEIDGNFNAALGLRQPGSAFKPFVYAEALLKGFTPETVVFDVPTEFSTECKADGTPIIAGNEDKCYMPVDYDGKYRGPISFRNALAQSVNIPAIKVLYLAGLKDSLRLAKDMGLTTLTNTDRYGLTLVLGGGEVKLLEMTSAYGVFANQGVLNPPTGILRIEGRNGEVLEEYGQKSEQVLDKNVALKITDMLSDNEARAPAFGQASPLYFPGRDVADKTGTTNDYRDAWIIGYTPNLAVGAWAGNNDNRPMHKIAAFIVAPLWNAFMNEAIRRLPVESFEKPPEEDLSSLPPILRGIWQGGSTYFVDKLTGARATEFTPPEFREERAVRSIHSILYWIDKSNPRVPRSTPPETDSQFPSWEYGVRKWVNQQGMFDESPSAGPAATDSVHKPEFSPQISVLSPLNGSVLHKGANFAQVNIVSHFPIKKVDFFVNNSFVASAEAAPWQASFVLDDSVLPGSANQFKAVGYDVVGNQGQTSVTFSVAQ